LDWYDGGKIEALKMRQVFFKQASFYHPVMNGCIILALAASLLPRFVSGSERLATILALISGVVALFAYFGSIRKNGDATWVCVPALEKSGPADQLNRLPVDKTNLASQARIEDFLDWKVQTDLLWPSSRLAVNEYILAQQYFALYASMGIRQFKNDQPKIPQSERLRKLLVALGTDDIEEPLVVTVGSVKIEISGEEAKVHLASARAPLAGIRSRALPRAPGEMKRSASSYR
jgi:hypothetical protein